MHRIRDLGGSWMKITSAEFFWVSKMISVKTLFFLTFCEKIFRLFLIISCYHPWLGGLSWSWFPWFLVLSLSAIRDWIFASKRGTCCHLLCVHLCSWCIWSCEGMVHPSWWKGQKGFWLWQASRKGGDSSQLHAKEFVGRRRKWYQKEIKKWIHSLFGI